MHYTFCMCRVLIDKVYRGNLKMAKTASGVTSERTILLRSVSPSPYAF